VCCRSCCCWLFALALCGFQQGICCCCCCCCCCDTGDLGVRLSKDLTAVAASALQKNMVTLGPLVLPFSEKFLFAVNLLKRKFRGKKVAPYTPDFQLAFDHICIHSGEHAPCFVWFYASVTLMVLRNQLPCIYFSQQACLVTLQLADCLAGSGRILLVTSLRRKFSGKKVAPYTSDFWLSFDHICIHSGECALFSVLLHAINRHASNRPSRLVV
jgi:hypothetical protein